VAYKKITMKKLLFGLLTLVLVSCTFKKNHDIKQSGENNLLKNLESTDKQILYPNITEYTDDYVPDTMFSIFNNVKLLITPYGKVYKENDSLFFDIKSELEIEKLFLFKIDNDFITIYVDTDGDVAGSFAKRISTIDKTIIWETHVAGFNLAKPVIKGTKMYLSTIGFIGKLDINSGIFDWKFDDLYNNGKYNSFDEPKFLNNNMVLFTSGQFGSSAKDSILVDDYEGKFLKINR
jgi:hypothetical protein